MVMIVIEGNVDNGDDGDNVRKMVMIMVMLWW